jgi:anti-sigma-K factor RskA
VLVLWALPRDGKPFVVGSVPAGDKGNIPLADTSEKLFSNVPRLGVSLEAALPAPGAAPSAFVLTGHCVKLW